MTIHVPFVDGDPADSNRVKAAWLNDINQSVYQAIGDGTNAPLTPQQVKDNLDIKGSDVGITLTTFNLGITAQTQLDNLGSISGATNVGLTHSNSAPVINTVEGFIRDTGIINVSDSPWNIVPGATDWAAQFMALGAFMRATDTNWNLKFPPGEYLTSRNEWSKGIRSLIIDGDGATLRNIHPDASGFRQSAFVGNFGVFSTVNFGDVYDASLTTFGYLFNSVAAAQSAIVLSTASDVTAGAFVDGSNVLLYGQCQQLNSFPPLAEVFEWNVVLTADAVTGAITFKYPLKYEYDANWWPLAGDNGGPPKILNLDRAGQNAWGQYLEINGLTFGVTPGHSTDKCAAEGYDRVVLRGVKAEQINIVSCRQVEIIECHTPLLLLDKFIDSVRVNGGDCALQQGAGVNFLNLEDGLALTGQTDIAARNVVIDGAILAGTGLGPTTVSVSINASCRSFHIRSAIVSPPVSTVVAVTNGSTEQTFLIDSVVSNTKILVAAATDIDAFAIVKLRLGKWYALQDGTKRVKLTKVYKEDASNMAVEGEFTSIPVPGETYRADFTEIIRRENLRFRGPFAGALKLHQSTSAPLGLWDGDKAYFITIDSRDLPRPATGGPSQLLELYCRGRLRRIYTNVIGAYTGASLTPFLTIQARTPGVVTYQSIDVLTTGTRESTAFGVNGSTGTDTLVATGGDYVDSMRFILVNGGTYPAYTDPVELPKFEIQVEVLRP